MSALGECEFCGELAELIEWQTDPIYEDDTELICHACAIDLGPQGGGDGGHPLEDDYSETSTA